MSLSTWARPPVSAYCSMLSPGRSRMPSHRPRSQDSERWLPQVGQIGGIFAGTTFLPTPSHVSLIFLGGSRGVGFSLISQHVIYRGICIFCSFFLFPRPHPSRSRIILSPVPWPGGRSLAHPSRRRTNVHRSNWGGSIFCTAGVREGRYNFIRKGDFKSLSWPYCLD